MELFNLISNYLQASGRVQLSDQIPHFQAGGDNTHPVPRVSHSLQPKVIDKVDRSVAQSGHNGLLSLGLVSPNLNLEGFFAFAGKRLFWEKNVFGTKTGEIVSF